MGNDIQRPKLSLAKDENRLKEYTVCRMSDIVEATEFWISSMRETPIVNLAEFEEVCI